MKRGIYSDVSRYVTSSYYCANQRFLLAVEKMHAIVQWLANLNIKINMTSMFVNKKDRYTDKSLKQGIYTNKSLIYNQSQFISPALPRYIIKPSPDFQFVNIQQGCITIENNNRKCVNHEISLDKRLSK